MLLASVLLMPFGGSFCRAEGEPSPFRPTYVRIEWGKNFPMAYTQQRLSPGTYEPILTYVHDLDAHWLMGFGGQFKVLRRDASNRADTPPTRYLALLTLVHETLFAYRLTHPFYLLAGAKILYILPSGNARLPLTRDNEFQVEIGGALTVQVAAQVFQDKFLSLRLDRWRGTRTQELQGSEVALGLSWPVE